MLCFLASLTVTFSCALDASGRVADQTSREAVRALQALPYASSSPDRADPARSGVVHHRPERSQPGFTLYTVRDACRAELIDPSGRLVHAWQDAGCLHWSHAELLPTGDLVVAGMERPGDEDPRPALERRFVLRLGWEGEEGWRARVPAHHDVQRLSADELLTLTLEQRTVAGFGLILDNSIAVLAAGDGGIRERLSLWDLLGQGALPLLEAARVDGAMDLFHANSVQPFEAPPVGPEHPLHDRRGVLVSIRHQDAVVAIDTERRELAWVWGRGEVSGPHHASLLADGNVLLFDNGLERGWSRVVEVDPMEGRIVWEYRAPQPTELFSPSRGSAQRLANGNTLIACSDRGRALEVTADGSIVWDFFYPELDSAGRRGTLVRVERYDTSFLRPIVHRHIR